MTQYKFFIDESGDHSLKDINQDFPYFILCGILISDEDYKSLVEKIKKLKLDFFQDENTILHSRDIRRCEKDFKILFNNEIRENFYRQLNAIIEDSNFQIIAVAVRKNPYFKKYGYLAKNPYHICLEYIIERLTMYLNQDDNIHVFVEKRGKKEDKELLSQYNIIRSRGTFYINSSQIISRIKKFDFRNKTENDIGIQIADLCAYPISSYLKNSQEMNPAFTLIKSKFLKKDDEFIGIGLKILP